MEGCPSLSSTLASSPGNPSSHGHHSSTQLSSALYARRQLPQTLRPPQFRQPFCSECNHRDSEPPCTLVPHPVTGSPLREKTRGNHCNSLSLPVSATSYHLQAARRVVHPCTSFTATASSSSSRTNHGSSTHLDQHRATFLFAKQRECKPSAKQHCECKPYAKQHRECSRIQRSSLHETPTVREQQPRRSNHYGSRHYTSL